MFTSKMRAFPGHESFDRIHLTAEGHRLFAEQLLQRSSARSVARDPVDRKHSESHSRRA
jgi:hypothetical protein